MAKLKILKLGETDISSTDIWRFCIHSDYPTQKIYTSGQTTLTIPAGSDTGTTTINHSLGYAPIVMAMFETEIGRFVKVSGQVKIFSNAQTMQYFSVSVAGDYISTVTGYGPGAASTDSYVSLNDVIRFTSSPGNVGILPSPLQANTDYFVVNIVDSIRFQVSITPGGAAVDILDGGGTYSDIFANVTNPYIDIFPITYGVISAADSITLSANPSIGTPNAGADIVRNIYYIILYDQI